MTRRTSIRTHCAAKNLVLSGVRSLAVHDDEVAQPVDLAAQVRALMPRGPRGRRRR
jgi:hypothetical protein